jgi:hypothetical protein
MKEKSLNQIRGERLLQSYGIDISKSGAGSRGGKVIGHTKSGKPVYEKHLQPGTKHKVIPHYDNFSKEDHEDAQNLHNKILTEAYQKHGDKMGHHVNEVVHRQSENYHKGKTQDVEKSEDIDLQKGEIENGKITMTKKEFKDEHERLINTLESETKEDDQEEIDEQKDEAKKYDIDLEKGGEGSKGGMVIGHTQSGKAVYQKHSANHESYSDFSSKDHKDASKLHHRVSENLSLKSPKDSDWHRKISNQHKDDIKKSEENDIEKGRKATPYGMKSSDGKYIKTTTGWKRVEMVKTVVNKDNVAEGMKNPHGMLISDDPETKAAVKNHIHDHLTKLRAEKNGGADSIMNEDGSDYVDQHAKKESEAIKTAKHHADKAYEKEFGSDIKVGDTVSVDAGYGEKHTGKVTKEHHIHSDKVYVEGLGDPIEKDRLEKEE